jgi:hypothetical protein
MPDARFALGNL